MRFPSYVTNTRLQAFSWPTRVSSSRTQWNSSRLRHCSSGGSTPNRRVFSGIQPTGVPHLGNWLGAVKNWTRMQDEYGGVHCVIVDLHAITLPQDPMVLRKNVFDMAAALIACGIDPSKTTLFVQSHVREHAELMWLLSCMTPMGWLNRMTQFKDKSKKKGGASNAALGLYSYPVLQAADILLYKATDVPVGEDQLQHLELARDVATTFNHTYKTDLLVPPKAVLVPEMARVMSLRDGTSKMSKSDSSDLGRINLTDSADDIARKIRKAKSDTFGIIRVGDNGSLIDAEQRPEVVNLVGILAVLTGRTSAQVLQEHAGSEMGPFKAALTEALVQSVCPLGSEIARLQQDPAFVNAALDEGAAKAQAIASDTLADIKRHVGVGRF